MTAVGLGYFFHCRTVLGRMEFGDLDWEAIEGGFLLGDRERVDERPLSHFSYHARGCYENK